jgi:pimeloyl-ACP methyl ester carboxylesterase
VYVGDHEYLVRQVGATDGPDVVLVHGLGGASLAEWFKIGPLLAERYHLTIVDNRSHGLSPKTTGRFEIEDVADDIAAVVAQLGIAEADFIGYSMGGAVTQAIAHRHPHLVRRLVLIATFARHPRSWRLARVAGTLVIRAWERVTGVGSAEVRAGYLLATGAVDAQHARWLWEETHRRDPEAGAAASLALLRFDSTAWIGSIRAPAMVIIPLSDQLVPNRWQYELAELLRSVTLVELVGARHEAPFTHAGQICEAVVEFFEKTGE